MTTFEVVSPFTTVLRPPPSANTAAAAPAASLTGQTVATRAPRRVASDKAFITNSARATSMTANSTVRTTAPTMANSTVVVPVCLHRITAPS